jgi:O-antigen/teichoic acid export membrane protein
MSTATAARSLADLSTTKAVQQGARETSPRQRAVQASLWTIVGYGLSQAIRLAGNIVVSRLLFPEAFGLMALVNVFIQGLEMFSDVGIGPAIIQSTRGDEPRFLNTAWTVQALRGMLLFGCSLAMAAPLAAFYEESQLAWLIPWAGLSAAVSGFNSTSCFLARRHLHLAQLTMLELSSQAIGIAVMCLWAWWQRSATSLVGGTLVIAALRMLGSHWFLRGPRNCFAWERAASKALFHFGKWVFVSTILTFCTMQIDRILLGKLIPIGMLGTYSVALAVATLPGTLLTAICLSVLYPLLATDVRDALHEIERRLHVARAVLLSIGAILVIGMAWGAPLFFGVLFDARYQGAAAIAQLLAPCTWFVILGMTLDRTLHALGDTRSMAAANLVKCVATAAATLIGFELGGLPGFILGMAVGTATGHFVIVVRLRSYGVCAIRQDVLYTLPVLCASLAAYIAPRGSLAFHFLIALPPLVMTLALGAWWTRVKYRALVAM